MRLTKCMKERISKINYLDDQQGQKIRGEKNMFTNNIEIELIVCIIFKIRNENLVKIYSIKYNTYTIDKILLPFETLIHIA